MSYRVTVTPSVFSIDDPLVLAHAEGSTLDLVERRVTRTPTLDQSVVLTDLGYTHGDRTFELVEAGATAAQIAAAKYLCANYTTVVVATWDGVYQGALQNVNLQGDSLLLTVLVTACLSEE